MSDTMIPLSAETPFQFSCDKTIACFNECCRDLNQFLTPYDILRIKKGLNMNSGDFLEKYCRQHTGSESGFPIITLKPVDSEDLKCPFITPTGCGIYDDRPSSCRMYPLVRAISRNRESGQLTEHYLLMKEPHCRGFDQDSHQTVNQWISHQGLKMYNVMNDMLMDVISTKNQCSPGPMDMATSRLFHLACYDLDNFRPYLFEKGGGNHLTVAPDLLQTAKTDDEALLKIGMMLIKQAISEKSH